LGKHLQLAKSGWREARGAETTLHSGHTEEAKPLVRAGRKTASTSIIRDREKSAAQKDTVFSKAIDEFSVYAHSIRSNFFFDLGKCSSKPFGRLKGILPGGARPMMKDEPAHLRGVRS
jgi:hypothetical protein